MTAQPNNVTLAELVTVTGSNNMVVFRRWCGVYTCTLCVNGKRHSVEGGSLSGVLDALGYRVQQAGK